MTIILDYLLPRACVLCGLGLSAGHFCQACKADMPLIDAACERCGVPLPTGAICMECQRKPPPFEKAFAPLLYTFPIDTALKALKFNRQLFLAPAFGALLVPLHRQYFATVDALLPVPLHRFRHARRGFNQAVELCRPLRKTSGMPLVENVQRARPTKPQTGLDATERRRNMKNAFVVRGKLRCRQPLLIDDVVTTGETCRQLSRTLLSAGADKVSVLAVARAASP